MPKYAPFGNAVWGLTVWGSPPTVSDQVVITVTPYEYTGLQLRWSPLSSSQASEQLLLRSSFGYPQSIYDGTPLLDETSSDGFSAGYIDTGLRSGHFYYYTLFVYDTLLGSYIPSGSAQGLVLTDWDFAGTYEAWLPDFYSLEDSALGTELQPEGPLTRYLQLLGFETDWIRSEIESLFLMTSVDKVSGSLLPYLGGNLGIGYEPALGMSRSRVLAKNAVYLYQSRGTMAGVVAAASSYSGYGCTGKLGYNESIQLDDAAFDSSVGHWFAANSATTITTATALSYGVTPPHTAYDPIQGVEDPSYYLGVLGLYGYMPPNNINVGVVGAPSSTVHLTTCIAASSSATSFGIPVQPEQEVSAGISVYPADGVIQSFYLQIDWYNQYGMYLSSTSGSSVSEVTSSWVELNVTGSASEIAAYYGVSLISVGALGSDKHLIDAYITTSSASVPVWQPPRDFQISLYPNRQNLVPNPVGLGGTYGWSITGGTFYPSFDSPTPPAVQWPENTSTGFIISSDTLSDLTVLTEYGDRPYGGHLLNALLATFTTEFDIHSVAEDYCFSTYVQPVYSSVFVELFAKWYNAEGVFVAEYSSGTSAGTGNFTRVVLQMPSVPSSAVKVELYITFNGNRFPFMFYVGGTMLEPVLYPRLYFDANFSPASDFLWEGTPNQSTSDYYPNLPESLTRLATVLPNYVPIGATFSLLVGSANDPTIVAPAIYELRSSTYNTVAITNGGSGGNDYVTYPITGAQVGDLIWVAINLWIGSPEAILSVTDTNGSVPIWQQGAQQLSSSSMTNLEIWWGIVTYPGDTTLEITWDGTQGYGLDAFISVDDIKTSYGSLSAWILANAGALEDTTGTAIEAVLPELSQGDEPGIYIGYGDGSYHSWTAGATPGVTYDVDAKQMRDLNCSALSSVQPSAPFFGPTQYVAAATTFYSQTGPEPGLGMYAGSLSSVLSTCTGLGVTPQYWSAYTDGETWETIGATTFESSGINLIVGVALAPNNDLCTNIGPNIGQYTQLALNLKAAGYTSPILRLGWEANGYEGYGFQWVLSGYAAYVSAFKQVAAAMRAVLPNCLIDFNTNSLNIAFADGQPLSDWDPGVEDIISVDFYDNGYPYCSENIALTATYAATQGKLWGVGEWGLNNTDDPAFITQVNQIVRGYFGTLPALYHSYFDANTSTLAGYPESATAYTLAFG